MHLAEVWYVIGDPDMDLFATKEQAEVWARVLFSEEPIERRYARIRFKPILWSNYPSTDKSETEK
jgi:hypothetical protein